jgi:hypothetical protein
VAGQRTCLLAAETASVGQRNRVSGQRRRVSGQYTLMLSLSMRSGGQKMRVSGRRRHVSGQRARILAFRTHFRGQAASLAGQMTGTYAARGIRTGHGMAILAKTPLVRGQGACDLLAMTAPDNPLTPQDRSQVAALLTKVGITLGMPHAELGKYLGVSRRSYSRWALEGTYLLPRQGSELAALAYPHDPSLAAELAAVVGETLVSLGLELAPPPPPAPVPVAEPSRAMPGVDAVTRMNAVVCAAAEAIDASPRTVRPALLAALRCAREVGLTVESMLAILEPGAR